MFILRRSIARRLVFNETYDVLLLLCLKLGRQRFTKRSRLDGKSVISACKSLEEEICQIALLLLFFIHHTHLGFSGGCHTIEYGAIAYQKYAYSRSAFLAFLE